VPAVPRPRVAHKTLNVRAFPRHSLDPPSPDRPFALAYNQTARDRTNRLLSLFVTTPPPPTALVILPRASSSIASTTTTTTTTLDHHPPPSVKLEADGAGQYLDDAHLEDFALEEDLLLLSADNAQGAEYAMGNAASTDQSGAASGGGGGPPSAGASGDTGGALAPDNPGFARMQGVTAARAEGQRTKPRGPPVSASQYDFLQVRGRAGGGGVGVVHAWCDRLARALPRSFAPRRAPYKRARATQR